MLPNTAHSSPTDIHFLKHLSAIVGGSSVSRISNTAPVWSFEEEEEEEVLTSGASLLVRKLKVMLCGPRAAVATSAAPVARLTSIHNSSLDSSEAKEVSFVLVMKPSGAAQTKKKGSRLASVPTRRRALVTRHKRQMER